MVLGEVESYERLKIKTRSWSFRKKEQEVSSLKGAKECDLVYTLTSAASQKAPKRTRIHSSGVFVAFQSSSFRKRREQKLVYTTFAS